MHGNLDSRAASGHILRGGRRALNGAPALLAAGVAAAALSLSGPLAATATAADSCPNAAVRAQQTATGLPSLPDCRAYELVNPGTDDFGEVNRVSNISDDGNIAAYLSVIPGDTALGGGISSTSVARRTAAGWSSVPADPPSYGSIFAVTGGTSPIVFSTDFTRELAFTTMPAIPTDTDGQGDFYRVDVGMKSATLMTQDLDVQPGEIFAATANLDRVLFRHNGSSPTSGIYASDGHSLELLSLDPSGVPFGPQQAVMAGAAYQRGLGVGRERDAAPWVERNGNRGASDDLQRVYFYNNIVTSGGFLYVRDHQTTFPVSASQRAGDVGTMSRANFISGSHDGSVAYFESAAQLTDAATPGGGIYRYDLASHTLTQLTPAADPAGLALAGAISSDDQSHIYFTSTSALAGAAQAGDQNAYVWTSEGGVRFIAKVASGDKFQRVTPDGRYALILSAASIGGAPNNGFTAVYRYDDVSGQTVCVSCRPDGTPSNGNAQIEAQSPGFPGSQITHNRSLTFAGDVTFTSSDRIVAADQTSASDVYLYGNGEVSLLSAGRGDYSSYVAETSDDGRNIFIVTRSALVGSDRDADEFDVYVARVDGGFLEPPPPSDPCRGDDCRGPLAGPPAIPAPTSSRTANDDRSSSTTSKKLSVAALSAGQRARLSRRGVVTLRVRVVGGGRLSIRGRGRVGGRTKTLASASRVVSGRASTTVPVTVRLSRAARRQLARSGRLRVTFVTRLGGLPGPKSVTVDLAKEKR